MSAAAWSRLGPSPSYPLHLKALGLTEQFWFITAGLAVMSPCPQPFSNGQAAACGAGCIGGPSICCAPLAPMATYFLGFLTLVSALCFPAG